MKKKLLIAIDGPAGAGKSTAARRLAAVLGYRYVDSGAMYRAVGLAARRRGVDPDDAEVVATLVVAVTFVVDAGGTRVLLEGEDVTAEMRAPDAGAWASRVAAHALVRARLLDRQRELAADGGGGGRRAAVLLPAPAGPSMAMSSFFFIGGARGLEGRRSRGRRRRRSRRR